MVVILLTPIVLMVVGIPGIHVGKSTIQLSVLYIKSYSRAATLWVIFVDISVLKPPISAGTILRHADMHLVYSCGIYYVYILIYIYT